MANKNKDQIETGDGSDDANGSSRLFLAPEHRVRNQETEPAQSEREPILVLSQVVPSSKDDALEQKVADLEAVLEQNASGLGNPARPKSVAGDGTENSEVTPVGPHTGKLTFADEKRIRSHVKEIILADLDQILGDYIVNLVQQIVQKEIERIRDTDPPAGNPDST